MTSLNLVLMAGDYSGGVWGVLSLASRKSHSTSVGQVKAVRKLFRIAEFDQFLLVFGRDGALHDAMPQLLQGGEFFGTEGRSHERSHTDNMQCCQTTFQPARPATFKLTHNPGVDQLGQLEATFAAPSRYRSWIIWGAPRSWAPG
jgi:hypothetical protein